MSSFYIKAKQFIPNIHFLWCNEFGHILENQSVTPDGPIQENMSTEEIMREVREYRNRLLINCDWTQLSDAPLTIEQIELWRNYRQSLRDFPEQINQEEWSGPYWPTPPN
jgi:hypothetical protein